MRVPRIKVSRVSLLAGLYLFAATAPRIAAFLLLPVYAFVLPPDQLAAYGVAISLASLIGILSDAGVVPGMGATYWLQPEEARASYLKSAIILSRVLSVLIMIPIGFLMSAFWDRLFGSGLREAEGLWLILAFAFLQRGNTLAGAIYRYRRQHKQFALTRILPASVQVVTGALFVFVLRWGALGAVAAAPLGFMVSIVIVGLRRSQEETAPFKMLSWAQAREVVARGAPILPEQLARWAQMLSLRPLMSLLTTLRATADFTFSSAPSQLVAPFSEAYEQFITPRYYESSSKHDLTTIGRLREITSVFMALGAAGTIVAIVAFDPVFRAFAPTAYQDTSGLAAIGLAGMVLRGPMALLVHNMRIEDRRLGLVGTVAIATLVSYLQFFLLVKSFGAYSAAWSVYLYPAVACAFSFAFTPSKRLRLVSGRDLLTTGLVVAGVLLIMVGLRARSSPTQPIEHLWLLALIGLIGIGIVAWLVIRPHLDATLAVVRGGLTAPHQKEAQD